MDEQAALASLVSEKPGISRWAIIVSWVLRSAAALILLQTLFFKFTGAPESVYIFTRVGAEPWGRLASGAAELVAAVLLLVPATTTIGAALAAGIMLGAVGSHLLILGVAVPNQDGTPGSDGGLLFALALVVLAASLGVLGIHRREIPIIGPALGA
ncbi:MAG: DoxX family protein [Phycisphaerales bacterium]